MNIKLSKDLENSIQSAVQNGRFASVDDAMTQAARLLLEQPPSLVKPPLTAAEFDQYLLNIGLMSQVPDGDADLDDPEDPLIDIQGESLSETVIRERR